MRLYSLLLSVLLAIICITTTNANVVDNNKLVKRDKYCCDKVWQGINGGFICRGQWVDNMCQCNWQKKNCCDCDRKCGWFERNIGEAFTRKDCS